MLVIERENRTAGSMEERTRARETNWRRSEKREREANLGRSEEGKSNRARSGKPELKRWRSEKRGAQNCTTGPPYIVVHSPI